MMSDCPECILSGLTAKNREAVFILMSYCEIILQNKKVYLNKIVTNDIDGRCAGVRRA
jgi:hypothetical protein